MDGYFYEHGPYLFYTVMGNLTENPYSWNLNASVIYLESPAGVGYSIMGSPVNNNTNDFITAHDNLEAVLQWFQKFPEYVANDFYVIGESYGGVYVPTLAHAILDYNEEVGSNGINLIGIGVGNGVTDWSVDCTTALLTMGWTHAFMNSSFNDQVVKDCTDPLSSACAEDYDEFMDDDMVNVNLYNLYGYCYPNEGFENYRYTPWVKQHHKRLELVPPCLDASGAQAWFSTPAARAAYHISPQAAEKWEICTDPDQLNYTTSSEASFWTYPYLIESGLKIMIYSGDADGSVPFVGTRAWIKNLNLVMTQDHTAWLVDGQVAGWTEVYDGLTFVTVRGAGHMVPQYKPAQALQMLQSYLFNLPY